MTFDEWESTHPPMQTESPNAYARRAFNAGVRGKGAAPQAECAPREDYQSAMDILLNIRAHGGGIDEAIAMLSVCADGGKGEAVQNVMNIPLDAAATMADYVPQAECAPREDYQSALDILANVRAHGGDFDSAIALLKSRQDRAAPREENPTEQP